MVKMLMGFIALSVGMVTAADLASAATSGQLFVGSKADIAGIRSLVERTPSEHFYGAHVVGEYALTHVGDEDAGWPEVFKRISGEKWKRLNLGGGGGPMWLSSMLKGGIPKAMALQLCSDWGDMGQCALNQ